MRVSFLNNFTIFEPACLLYLYEKMSVLIRKVYMTNLINSLVQSFQASGLIVSTSLNILVIFVTAMAALAVLNFVK